MEKEVLQFVIEGSFINNFAKEKLLYDNDLNSALELIESCLVSNEINDNERKGLAWKVLDGQFELAGNSRDGITLSETEKSGIIVNHLNKMRSEIKELKEELQEVYQRHANQLEVISNVLPEWELSRINTAWSMYDGPSTEKPIFELTDSYHEEVRKINKELSQSMTSHEEEEETESKFFKKINIVRPHSDEYYLYGWLEPNGTFHEVKWEIMLTSRGNISKSIIYHARKVSLVQEMNYVL